MKAKIIMIVDGEEYPYGTYPFETPEEVLKVNQIAEKGGADACEAAPAEEAPAAE